MFFVCRLQRRLCILSIISFVLLPLEKSILSYWNLRGRTLIENFCSSPRLSFFGRLTNKNIKWVLTMMLSFHYDSCRFNGWRCRVHNEELSYIGYCTPYWKDSSVSHILDLLYRIHILQCAT